MFINNVKLFYHIMNTYDNIDNEVSQNLPDLQNTAKDFPPKYVPGVGVTNLELPITILSQDNVPISATGMFSIFVDLPAENKGINMSRINIIAHESINNEVSSKVLPDLINRLKEKVGAENAYAKVEFTYFIKKKAPITEYYGYVPYKCSVEAKTENGEIKMFQSMEVIYTSLCPCSKEISDYSAHNQPSFGNLKVEIAPDKFLWFEDMARLVEDNASSEMYSILKRADEKSVTERAYDNPVFVEDIVRGVAKSCDSLLDDVILDYSFYTQHKESIHVSWATAYINANRRL